MRRTELTILIALAVLGMAAAFWLLVIGPKRDQAASLQQDIDGLRSALSEAEQAAAAGAQARDEFTVNYRRLVVLGKAVPADGDQAGLLVQLQRLADRAGVQFQSIDLASGDQTASTSTTPPPESSSSELSAPSETASTSTVQEAGTTTSSTAPPTEVAAATLPIGASVGPAGLPVMPYDLKFSGDFFQIADFLRSLDRMVEMPRGQIDVTGRLLTVDGFALSPEQGTGGASLSPVPTLTASLSVTTYLAPADQGTTAGASPSGPAPVSSSAVPTPTSSTTSSAPTSSEPVPTP